MESATSRFFAITELVNHLGLFLDRKEASIMMQTSRKLSELCAPAFYNDITAECRLNERLIFSSKDSIHALARNTHHVRQLTLNIPEVAYYTNCIIAYQDEILCAAASDTTNDNHPPQQHCFRQERQQQQRRPLWLPPPDPRDCALFPIPPITLLTKLTFHVEYDWPIRHCSYLLPSAKDPKAILACFCWIMDLNPNLLEVSLDRVFIKDQRDIRLLATSIFGLKNLQTLHLGFYHKFYWEMPPDLASMLFFCCPASLQSLDISLDEENYYWEDSISDEYLNTAQGQLQPWENDEVDCGIPTMIPRRQEPLLSLTSLDIFESRDDNGVSEYDLVAILAHCPNLISIGIPCMTEIRDVDHLAKEIARLCPNLSSVRNVQPSGSLPQRLSVRLLRTLPHQQIKVFSCRSFRRIKDPDLADLRWHFQRHSSTLRSIEFTGYQNFDSRTIQVILSQCVALEHFTVAWTEFDTSRQLCVHLEDVIDFPWRCTRIQELQLTVAIPDEPLHRLAEGTVPYYNRPAPITLSTAEKDQFKCLEAFYRQIGSLTELQTLKLRAIFYDPQGHRPISRDACSTFPGMLSLGCEETGRPGFLPHLAGLTKLKKLLGSVFTKTEENQATVGIREVEWMKCHWPVLDSYFTLARRYSDSGSDSS